MSSAGDGWAVGGTTMLHWNGATWTQSPAASCSLSAVSMVSASDGWAVGDCILHWDGTTWIRVFNPSWFALTSVAMVSSSDGWAVGPGGVFLHWDGRAWANANATPYSPLGVALASSRNGWAVGWGIQHWDGRSWSGVASPTSRRINAVSLASPASGWAVGGRSDLTLHRSNLCRTIVFAADRARIGGLQCERGSKLAASL